MYHVMTISELGFPTIMASADTPLLAGEQLPEELQTLINFGHFMRVCEQAKALWKRVDKDWESPYPPVAKLVLLDDSVNPLYVQYQED